MNVKYADAHCHIQFEQYAHDDEEVITRMRENGIAAIIVGVDLASSQKAVALAEKHEHLFASVGLHPNHAAEPFSAGGGSASGGDEEAFRQLARHPKVVAIGECGLDYFRPAEVNEEVKRVQKEVLQKHIELAVALDKPLIIHARPSSAKATEGKPSRDAYQDLIAILKEAKIKYPNLRGDIHFFVGGIQEAEALIALNFTVSFTAVITFARDYDAVIRAVPLASILSETDAPYIAPASRRGERNDPLAVIDVVAKIAEIRGEPLDTVRAALLANTKLLFALPMLS